MLCKCFTMWILYSITSITLSLKPPVEWARFVVNTNLRKFLKDRLLREGCDSRRGWIRAFERWQLHHKCESDTTGLYIDPIISSVTSFDDFKTKSFIEDLSLLDKMNHNLASIVAKDTLEYSKKLSVKLSELNNDLNKASDKGPEKIQYISPELSISDLKLRLKAHNLSTKGLKKELIDRINSYYHNLNVNNKDGHLTNYENLNVYEEESGLISYSLSPHQKKPFKIDKALREKLISKLNKENIPYSDTLIYCLLARYESLEGTGFQAAIPKPVFDSLVKNFNITLECFASPLNSRLENYCSAFSDIDCYFGSYGSFFEITLTEGSYQANPPFTNTFMKLSYEKVSNALQNNSSGPLSFAFVVPCWKEDEGWKILMESPYKTASILVPAQLHGYLHGARHKYPDADAEIRPSGFDTSIIFLQNYPGSVKWSVSDRASDEILKSFLATTDGSLKEKNIYIPKKLRGLS